METVANKESYWMVKHSLWNGAFALCSIVSLVRLLFRRVSIWGHREKICFALQNIWDEKIGEKNGKENEDYAFLS